MASELQISDIIDVMAQGGELPTLAPVMSKLVSTGDLVDFDTLIMILTSDSAMATRVISAANRLGGYDKPARDVRSAIERIGTKTARNLVISSHFIDTTSQEGLYDAVRWYWERALFNSVGARHFARHLKLDDYPHYGMVGLLIDIGVLFLLEHFPRQYLPLFDRWRVSGGSLDELEKEEFGFDHSVVGQALARKLSLGGELESLIRYHHQPDMIDAEEFNLDVLRLSRMTTGFFFEEQMMNSFDKCSKFGKEKFSLSRGELEDLLQQITLEADSVIYSISKDSENQVAYQDLLRTINLELGRATLNYDQAVRELEKAYQQVSSLASQLKDTNLRLREASNFDALTKVHNRRYFEEFLNWNFSRALRYGTTLGCLMVDIDHFKLINDSYGHLSGDQVLQGVAAILKENLRNTDVIARFGGEEFIVLLPETNPNVVMLIAQKLNDAVREEGFTIAEKKVSVTVSVGYVSFNQDVFPKIGTTQELVRCADENMYEAKRHGRDQIWPPAKGASQSKQTNVKTTINLTPI